MPMQRGSGLASSSFFSQRRSAHSSSPAPISLPAEPTCPSQFPFVRQFQQQIVVNHELFPSGALVP